MRVLLIVPVDCACALKWSYIPNQQTGDAKRKANTHYFSHSPMQLSTLPFVRHRKALDSRQWFRYCRQQFYSFLCLGAFAKSRKATIGFVMAVSPSVRLSVRSHSTDFHDISYPSIFRKFVEEVQFSSVQYLTTITGVLHKDK